MSSGETPADLTSVRQALAEKRYDDAVGALDALVSASPDDPEVLSVAGVAYAGKGDFPRALAYLNRSVELEPTAKRYYNLATVYRMRGDKAQAVSALQAALKLDPGYRSAQEALAEIGAAAIGEPAPVEPAAQPTVALPTLPGGIGSGEQPGYPSAPTPYGPPAPPPPPQYRAAPGLGEHKNWAKIILGGLMVGLPAILVWAGWAEVLMVPLGIIGPVAALGLMVFFVKWLADSAGAYEIQHWIVMIVLTGLLPSLLMIKGFDILAAGWYSMERR